MPLGMKGRKGENKVKGLEVEGGGQVEDDLASTAKPISLWGGEVLLSTGNLPRFIVPGSRTVTSSCDQAGKNLLVSLYL